jgi:hypothetical protein
MLLSVTAMLLAGDGNIHTPDYSRQHPYAQDDTVRTTKMFQNRPTAEPKTTLLSAGTSRKLTRLTAGQSL